jgi:hypothetical protein
MKHASAFRLVSAVIQVLVRDMKDATDDRDTFEATHDVLVAFRGAL